MGGHSHADITINYDFTTHLIVPDNGQVASVQTLGGLSGLSYFNNVVTRLDLTSGSDANNPMWLGDLYSSLTFGTSSEHASQRIAVLLNRPGVNSSDPFGSSLDALNVTLNASSGSNVWAATSSSGTYAADGRLGANPNAAGVAFVSGSNGLAALNGAPLASNRVSLLVADFSGGGTATLAGWGLSVSGSAASSSSFTPGANAWISDTGADATNSVGAVLDTSGANSASGGALLVDLAGSTTFSAGVSGTGGLTKTGTGSLVLAGSGSYTGTTTVSNGVLEVTVNNALGTAAAGTSVASGATLRLGAGLNYSTAEALSLSGAGYSGAGALSATGSGTTTFAGPITLANDATINTGGGTLDLTGGIEKSSKVLTFTGGGIINVTGTGIVGATANSDLVVNGTTVDVQIASTYQGSTTILNGGTLQAHVIDALPTANGRSALIMDDTGSGGSTLTLGASQLIASLTGAATSTVALGGNSLTVGTSSGSTTFAGVISGAGGSLIKDGASTLVLSGTNIYSGNTTINAGTLALGASGSIANSPLINVASGATLDVSAMTAGWTVGASAGQTLAGSGEVIGSITIGSHGTHAPGGLGVVGKQNISGDLHYASGSIFEWDLNANSTTTGFDMVGAGGAISVDTSNTVFRIIFGDDVNLSTAFWNTPYITQTWTMASIFGKAITSGYFTTVEIVGRDTSTYGSFSITAGGTAITWTAVPEPTSALVGLLLGTGLLRRRRESACARGSSGAL